MEVGLGDGDDFRPDLLDGEVLHAVPLLVWIVVEQAAVAAPVRRTLVATCRNQVIPEMQMRRRQQQQTMGEKDEGGGSIAGELV